MNCEHNRDPRSCPTCAPALVERFKTIGEAFAIARDLARCVHAVTVHVGPYHMCRSCGAMRTLPQAGARGLSLWRLPDIAQRAATLAARADLSNPFKVTG